MKHDWSIGTPARTARYSGRDRPAWRMNQTGVWGTGRQRAASTSGDADVRPSRSGWVAGSSADSAWAGASAVGKLGVATPRSSHRPRPPSNRTVIRSPESRPAHDALATRRLVALLRPDCLGATYSRCS